MLRVGFVAADAAGPAFQRLAEYNHMFLAGEYFFYVAIHKQAMAMQFYTCVLPVLGLYK